MDLADIRREYLRDGLHRANLKTNPFDQFELWMDQAIKSKIPDPTAMTLATVDSSGSPSQRIVLLKQFDNNGFIFYTNYNSKKARDLAKNANVSLHFPWHMMERQVKIQGSARKIGVSQSLKYFLSRPRESQLAAWASNQSHRIDSRTFLLTQFENMKQKFENGEVPLPDFWGGYCVEPTSFEFWQGGANRLHDRFQFTFDDPKWNISRLAP